MQNPGKSHYPLASSLNRQMEDITWFSPVTTEESMIVHCVKK